MLPKIKSKRGVGRGNGMLVTAVVIGFLILAAVVFFGVRQSITGEVVQTETKEGVLIPVIGKAATLPVKAVDTAQDNVNTRVQVPVYISTNGVFLETGGTATNAAGSDQTFTAGIAVQTEPYQVAAFNASFGSVNGPEEVIVTSESPRTVVHDVYSIAAPALTLFDEDDNALITVGGANLSLGADETGTFSKLRIKQTTANTAFRISGVYINLDSETNVSSIQFSDSRVDDDGTFPLASTTNDDANFALIEPILIFEFAQVELGPIAVQADGDGTSVEAFTLFVADSEYFFSQKSDEILFGPEDDSSSPATTGATDPSVAGFFL